MFTTMAPLCHNEMYIVDGVFMIYDTQIKSVLGWNGEMAICIVIRDSHLALFMHFTRILSAFAAVLVVFAHVLDNHS